MPTVQDRQAASPDATASFATKPDEARADGPGRRPEPRSVAEALHAIRARLAELQVYIAHYLAVRIDRAKYELRKLVLFIGLGAILALAAAGAIVTAVVLLCEGIAGGLGALFGHRWIGDLVTGILLLAGALAVVYFGTRGIIDWSHKHTKQRYEQRRARQRAQFHDEQHWRHS